MKSFQVLWTIFLLITCFVTVLTGGPVSEGDVNSDPLPVPTQKVEKTKTSDSDLLDLSSNDKDIDKAETVDSSKDSGVPVVPPSSTIDLTTLTSTPSIQAIVTNNCTNDNSTLCENDGSVYPGSLYSRFSDNKAMLMRTFYVLLGITGIIIVYFIVRTIRIRRRQSRTKRYGLLATRDDTLEMTPLDADDDEDDLTVFDINNRS